ncbi:hypothetical protein BBX50_18140 [Ensifer sp. LC11]|nr:hypothetical protein BBX50_18140 [Ensifer sp. LC11]
MKFGTADHIKYTTSATTSKADIVAAIGAAEPGLDPRQIELEFMVVGAGGAGASGESAFGGLAGIVSVKSIWLSDVPDGSIYIDIGAGGLGAIGDMGNGGSPTVVTFTGGRSIMAFGGMGGWPNVDAQRMNWVIAVGNGARYGDPAIVKDGPSNPTGPGNGGGRDPGYFGTGGASSTADNELALYTGWGDFGIAGSDANTNLYGQFGSGGSCGDGSTPGGKGGIPGGAGGASPVDLAGGPGERGEVRIRVIVWETL